MVAALAMLHPLPPSELAALVFVGGFRSNNRQQWQPAESDAYLGANPGGSLRAARLLVDPSLPGMTSCQAPAPLCGVSTNG